MPFPWPIRFALVSALVLRSLVPATAESNPGLLDILTAELNAKPVGANWLSYNGDLSGRRYSSLAQINVRNVEQLRAQWVFHAGTSDRLEVTPVVANGLMFVTAAN